MLFNVMCINKVQSGNRGRPRYDVQEVQLQFLVGFGFKVSEIHNGENVSGLSGHCKKMTFTRLWNFIAYKVLPEHFPCSKYRVTFWILREEQILKDCL